MTSPSDLDLAQLIVDEGFDAHDEHLTNLLERAGVAGIEPVLIDIAGDRTAPVPVRQRALGRLIVHLSRPVSHPQTPPPVAQLHRSPIHTPEPRSLAEVA